MRALLLCGLVVLAVSPAWATGRDEPKNDGRQLVAHEEDRDLALVEALATAQQCGIVDAATAKLDTFILIGEMNRQVTLAGQGGEWRPRERAELYREKGLEEATDAYCAQTWSSASDQADIRHVAQAILASE